MAQHRGDPGPPYPSRESSPSTADPSIKHCASVVSGSFFCKERAPVRSPSPVLPPARQPQSPAKASPSACQHPRLAGPADMLSASCGCYGRPASPAPGASPPADAAVSITRVSHLVPHPRCRDTWNFLIFNQKYFNCHCVRCNKQLQSPAPSQSRDALRRGRLHQNDAAPS